MSFTFDFWQPDSPYIETVWRTDSIGAGYTGNGSFISTANFHWEMVFTRQEDRTTIQIRGPETLATPAAIPEHAEFFGIVFTLGTFMPDLPVKCIVDGAVTLPRSCGAGFWLNSRVWEVPTFDNADVFLNRLQRDGLLAREPVIDTVLRDENAYLSTRSVQRRFARATGLTLNLIQQIERAQLAMRLLAEGKSILDTVNEAGYFDQPHLTRALKRFAGQTPAQLVLPPPPTPAHIKDTV